MPTEKEIARTTEVLRGGGICVIPTDTIYGVVGQALDQGTVDRLYAVKRRAPDKPLIILIASIEDLARFGVSLGPFERATLASLWPGKVSVILPCDEERFAYLHRGMNSLAFRLPKDEWLRKMLERTGPLVAPSANPEGLPPAETVEEAKVYFGETVDWYLDAGRRIGGAPSTLVSIADGKPVVLREGAKKIDL
jgi:L-threonylcarbamoyladenylate synthase